MVERVQRTVLLVEDDAALREVMAECLATDNYAVIQATGGDDAMRLAQLNGPDVILLDLAMPHRSGLDVLHALKRAAPHETSRCLLSAATHWCSWTNVRLASMV